MIAALQETKLKPTSSINTPGHSIVRLDRARNKSGGLAFLVNDQLKYRTIDLPTQPGSAPDSRLEQLAIALQTAPNHISIINIYIPPSSCCPNDFDVSIAHLFNIEDSIILGDVNSIWHSNLANDARGNALAEEIDASDHGTMNEPFFTRVVAGASSPDIFTTCASLLPSSTWITKPALCSDHVPIIISL